MRRALKHLQDNIHTHMLIPSHVDISQALDPLRKELIDLQAGVSMDCVINGTRQQKTVKALISCIIADHPQACDITRHLGVAANKACRLCWVSKEEKSKYSKDMLSHRNTRRRVETDLIVQEMKKMRSSLQLSNQKFKALSTATGIRPISCPFQGVIVDTHIQAFPDFDHFMDLGLVMRMFAFITESLSEKQLEEVELRMKCLKLPWGWNAINLNLKSVAKKMKPMTYMRKLCVLGIYPFQGFLEPPIYSLLVNLLSLRALMFTTINS